MIGSGGRQVLDLKGLRPPGADEKEVTCEVCSGIGPLRCFFFFCTGKNLEIIGPGPSHPLFSEAQRDCASCSTSHSAPPALRQSSGVEKR